MAVRELVRWVVGFDAKQVVAGMDDAKAAAAKLRDETAKVDKAVDGLGRGGQKVASMLGGPFGNLADIAFDLGEAAEGSAGAVGGLGATALGAAVGVAVLTYAGVQLAASAVEAAKRLEEQGLAGKIPEDARDSVENYTRNVQAMHNAVDLAMVTMGSVAVDAVGNFAAALTGVLSTSTDTVASIADLVSQARSFSTTVLDIMTLGGWFEGWDGAASELNAVLEEQVDVGEEIAKTQEHIKKQYDDNKEAAKAYAAEVEKLAKEERKRLADLRESLLDANSAAMRSDALRSIGLGVTGARVSGVTQGPAGGMAWASVTQVPTVSIITGAKVTGTGVGELTSALGGVGEISGLPTVGGLVGGIAKGLGSAALSSAASGAGLGGLAAAGPVGLGIAGAAGLPGLVGSLDGAVSALTTQFEGLPGALSHALETTLPHLLESLPDLAGAILEATVQIPIVLVQALPDILQGLIRSILESIKSILGFGGGDRSAREITSSRALTALQTGDLVGFRDAAEQAVGGGKRDSVGRRGEAQRGRPHEVHVHGVTDPRELLRRMRRELGGDYGASYATGDSL